MLSPSCLLKASSLLLSCCVPVRHAPPRASLVDNIDASLIRRYKADEVSRVLESWRAMAAGHVHEAELPGFEADEAMLRQQANSYVDGLPVQLFYEDPAASYAWAHALEEQAQVVRDEFLSVVNSDALERQGNNVWTGLADIRDESTVAYGPEWRTLGLQDRGVWDPVNTKLFPKTTALLKQSGTPCVEAFFAKMPAGTSIGAHSDECNFHLTSHLGIDVPEGECWLQVGDERREWRNGKLMLFDTSVMHCAANEAAVDRYVLMMRVWHPGLTATEVDALSWIFKCLDEPHLAEPPPTDWGNPRAAAAVGGNARSAVGGAAKGGMSRQARRQAERDAKKRAKAGGGGGFAKKEVAKKKR